ncbi:MAG: 5'-methylthioadenosine/S-adenosylhomocysteine nucleosidase [Desulfobacterales bacterium]|nr:5'-methylthioadenosine/S-adenosylhomocysteine nucleosidase [Desulfobacterales bacterium]
MEKNTLILLVMATMAEAKPFVLGMSLKESEQRPFKIFRNDNLILVISNVGKANAAMATAYCCQKFAPSCIFNLGASGASGSSHPLGGIFHITRIFEYDRPELLSNKLTVHEPDVLDGFQTATLSTSDMAILEPEKRRKVSKYADLMDMEGASVVQASRLFNTKCYLFKFVSDSIEHSESDDIIKNIRLYRTPFSEFFLRSVMPAI